LAPLLHAYKAPLTAASAPAFNLSLQLDLLARPSALALDSHGNLLTVGGSAGAATIASFAPPFSATSVPSVLNAALSCCYTGLAVGP
jgi:hypothetical protein